MNEQELARLAAMRGSDQPQQGQGMQLNINPDDFEDDVCECGNPYFEMVFKPKKLSRLHPQNPTGQDIKTIQQVLVCTKCRVELQTK